jgi:CheY-like chemotaxis protein
MPVMDGHAFLDALEGLEGPAAHAPVIVVTAMQDPREPRACAVLRKPYSMDQFDRVVSAACAQSASA